MQERDEGFPIAGTDIFDWCKREQMNLRRHMRQQLIAIFLLLSAESAFAADDALCLAKYKILSDQFYLYNEKSAAANAVMDRIATYYSETQPVQNIHKADARAWRAAIEAFIDVGQPFLQNLLEYKALGCSPDQQSQQSEQIKKVTDDLKYSRARLNSLISGLPASTFK